MPEWWTYELSDFLMFSARTWGRLLSLYHADLWPWGQAVALLAGLALLALLALLVPAAGGKAWQMRVACALLAAAWLWVAWAFHWQRFAEINWAARYYAGAFVLQAALLSASAAWLHRAPANAGATAQRTSPAARRTGLALLVFAVVLQPLLDRLLGRPWPQAQLFGLMPDPTVLATLGVWLAGPRPLGGPNRLLLPLPLLWCAVSGATAWTLG